jgi:hypothetical protein
MNYIIHLILCGGLTYLFCLTVNQMKSETQRKLDIGEGLVLFTIIYVISVFAILIQSLFQ